jgi:Fic family protein
MNKQWKPVGYETLSWNSQACSPYISKSNRRKIRSAVPQKIALLDLNLDKELSHRLDDILVLMARFDAEQSHTMFNFPALLLRSESAASSQIEHLTSSSRNIVLAELSPDAPNNARRIAGNVAAMKKALELSDPISIRKITEIHKSLILPFDENFAGKIRDEPVWIGGNSYSPHDAIFVPPHPDRVWECLEDLVAYANRTDINPIVKAAILHAQFETIHPFIDGVCYEGCFSHPINHTQSAHLLQDKAA